MSESKNHVTLYLSNLDKARLERNAGRNKSRYLTIALYALDYHRVMLFKITNRVNGRVFIGFDKPEVYFKTNILDRIPEKYKLINFDILEYGQGAFETKSLGMFENINEAGEYFDYQLNKLYDEGVTLYNDELWNGFTKKTVSVRLKFDYFRQVVEYCREYDITINTLILRSIERRIKKKRNRNKKKLNGL